MPAVEGQPRGPEDVKKKSSMRSILSMFRNSKFTAAVSQQRNPEKDKAQTALPFESRPQPPSSPYGDAGSSSVASLPAASSPVSSSSSASSLEFASEASTAATTPSTSSPSVVKEGLDLAWGASASSTAESTAVPPRRPQPAKKPSWTVPENYQKRLSPLASMEAAGPPFSLYPLPSPPPSPVLHDRRNSAMPKRRNSLGRLLSRGYQSNPDVVGMSEDSDDGAMPPMPTIPFSKPVSAGAPSRARSLRRRERGRADIEKPTSYTEQEKMEHESILGADPTGYGFYLYPKTSTPTSRRSSYAGGGTSDGGWGVVDSGRGSGSGIGIGSGSGRSSHGRRSWKEAKGRNLRRVMTSQIIMEEECGDETPPIVQPQRRHSMLPEVDNQWGASRQDAARPAVNGGNHARRWSLQNRDQLSSQIERHDGPFPAHDVSRRRGSDSRSAALRQLQQETNRFMIRCEDVDDDDDFGVRPVADKLSAGNRKNLNVQVPVLRVEMVNV